MQKQTTPSINAHLLRGALILVLLVATCTTPFALIGGASSAGVNAKAVERTIEGATPTGSPCAVLAYISNSDSNSVSVIDTSTNTVVATVPIGGSPRGVAVNSSGTSVYIAAITNSGAGIVSVIDTATNTVVATVMLGDTFVEGVAVNPAGTRAYIANSGSASVSVINTLTNTVIATTRVAIDPFGIAVNPTGTLAYVAAESGFVSVIDTSTNTVVATIQVGDVPLGVAVNPAGTFAYVANSADNNVSVIDTSTNTVVTTVNVQHSPFALGNFIGALPCLGGTPPPRFRPTPRPHSTLPPRP